MAHIEYDSICNLQKGRYTWNIKVRLLRIWKTYTKAGNPVKGLNLLLLDDKNDRIHCYLGDTLEKKYRPILTVGDVYTVENFTIKNYTELDINMPFKNDKEIMLSNYTTLQQVDEGSTLIESNAFDFYEIGDLHEQATQDKFLIDVIGVIQQVRPIHQFEKTIGRKQCHVKLVLTDGRSKVNVTFWDNFAIYFERSLKQNLEQPIILIIASGKVTTFRGQLEITNWFSTRFYLNYDHHSVRGMRKMLTQPFFSEYHMSTQPIINSKIFTVEEVKEFTEQYINVTIKKVKASANWVFYECTACQDEVLKLQDKFQCVSCNRELEYADCKFRVATICTDDTGSIGVEV